MPEKQERQGLPLSPGWQYHWLLVVLIAYEAIRKWANANAVWLQHACLAVLANWWKIYCSDTIKIFDQNILSKENSRLVLTYIFNLFIFVSFLLVLKLHVFHTIFKKYHKKFCNFSFIKNELFILFQGAFIMSRDNSTSLGICCVREDKSQKAAKYQIRQLQHIPNVW